MSNVIYLQRKTHSVLSTLAAAIAVVFLLYILHAINNRHLAPNAAAHEDIAPQEVTVSVQQDQAAAEKSAETDVFLSTIQTAQEASQQLLRTPSGSRLEQAVLHHWETLSTKEIGAAAEPEELYTACLQAPPVVRLGQSRCEAYADAIDTYVIRTTQ